MTDRELLQQVLDAWQDHWVDDNQSALLKMIRARLSQCERCGEVNPAEIHTCTPKSEWQGLTDEEIMEMLDYGQYGRVPEYARNFANAIEAKLKEKNT